MALKLKFFPLKKNSRLLAFAGRMEALSDIRARRARMKQQQSRTTDSSCTYTSATAAPGGGDC